ncbi:MAG: (Fe-S)-binding protein [Betaproteobacteria bacterium]|nr:(Fe-S)-binding protein [Betaproteobacteria bacterium]
MSTTATTSNALEKRARAVLASAAAPDARMAVREFVDQLNRDAAFQLETCVRCGQCADACHFYLVTRDSRYTPVYKLRPMLRAYQRERAPFAAVKRRLGLAPPEVTAAELSEWSELLYDACNLCGRCTLACPMGIDIAGLVRRAREGMSAAGFAPADLYKVAERALDSGSPVGIGWPTLKRQIEEQEKETGLKIPVDVEGADYLVILSSIEIASFPETIGALARIFKQAKVSWTVPSAGFEATNIGVQIGSRDVAAALLSRVVEAAERLKVKYVISPECGHAYSALRWEGPNLLGRPYPFKVVQIMELLDQLVREGRLRTRGKDTRRFAFHDPCQLVRRGGITEAPRRVMGGVSERVVELPSPGEANFCCGGGGGVSAIRRAEKLRFAAFACKKQQVETAGAEALVTACANCRNVLEEAIDTYHMTLPVLGLTELVAQYLEPDPAPALR